MMDLATILHAAAFGFLGYLCGSLPFSIWISHLVKGVDLRQAGSGHATTTNTIRQAGFVPGILVLVLDLAKGFLPTWLATQFAPRGWIAALAATLAVAGHCWPLFGGFRGGMGLATTGGALLAVEPLALLVSLVLLVSLLLILRHAARAGALVGILIFPMLWLVGLRDTVLWLALGAGGIITARFLTDWRRQYRELWLDRDKPTA